MSVIAVLIIFSLIVASGFLIAFLWAVKSGQFEDRYTPSVRILFDEMKKETQDQKTENHKQGAVDKAGGKEN